MSKDWKLVLLQRWRPTLSWSSCSLLAFSQTLSTFCRSTDASIYCTHSCSRRESLKLRASLYTSMIKRTSWTWPGGATTERTECSLCRQVQLRSWEAEKLAGRWYLCGDTGFCLCRGTALRLQKAGPPPLWWTLLTSAGCPMACGLPGDPWRQLRHCLHYSPV